MPAPKNNKQENKHRMSLIPLDLLAEMLCPGYEEGIEKYERESWREGFSSSIIMDACLRHLTKFFYDREDYDPQYPSKHHLGAAMFCIISMYDSWKNHKELDDRPLKRSVSTCPTASWPEYEFGMEQIDSIEEVIAHKDKILSDALNQLIICNQKANMGTIARIERELGINEK